MYVSSVLVHSCVLISCCRACRPLSFSSTTTCLRLQLIRMGVSHSSLRFLIITSCMAETPRATIMCLLRPRFLRTVSMELICTSSSMPLFKRTDFFSSAAGQPPHNAVLTHACKWRDSRGLCDKHVNEEKVTDHMTSHLPTRSHDLMVECQWDGCKLENYIRRDTILRHIRQVHLKIRPRRLS
jgi:hypothetical protein